MAEFKKRVNRLVAGIEQNLDEALFSLRKHLRLSDPLQIVPYRTYGTSKGLYIKGRVLEEKRIPKASATDSLLENIVSMYRRFESDEVPGVKINVNFQGQQHVVVTDSEGYFVLTLTPQQALPWDDMWFEIDLEIAEAPLPMPGPVKATAQVLVPHPEAEYGIISDIDDTIVHTSATSLLTMSRNTFFKNAHTRLPFAGVTEFYKALQLGRNGKRNNPFFYVSSSPWNLYDLLIDFMDINDIPEGPLLLRDFGIDADKVGSSDHMGHKYKEIENILVAYPQLNFVLIGDSGQEDPKIYGEVVRKFPGRILAVYIRDVQLADREKIAIDISRELAADKVDMVVVDNTVEAAEHAAKIKLIFTEALPEIVEDKKLDKGEKAGKEKIG
jgi:phosphatidate phosphatase APP1